KIRSADQRIVLPGRNDDARRVGCVCRKTLAHVKLLRLPRTQTFFKMLGELVRVSSRFISDRRKVSSELVLSVAVGRRARESRCDHERPEQAMRTDHVA